MDPWRRPGYRILPLLTTRYQLEVQTRARYDTSSDRQHGSGLSWPAETARYMTSFPDKPIWVIASFLLPGLALAAQCSAGC